MRLNADLFLNTNQISADYRRIFIHILKETFKGSEYETLVLQDDLRLAKPYTFSIGFSKIVTITSEKIMFQSPIYFDFSTPIHPMLSHLYNYLQVLEGKSVGPLRIDRVELFLPVPRKVHSQIVTLRTVGHMVLPVKEENDYEEAIKFSLKVKRKVLQDFFNEYVTFSEGDLEDLRVLDVNLKSYLVKHYGGFVRTFRGTITLSAPKNVLNFILESGLGIRTGQGFGTVKVVREWQDP